MSAEATAQTTVAGNADPPVSGQTGAHPDSSSSGGSSSNADSSNNELPSESHLASDPANSAGTAGGSTPSENASAGGSSSESSSDAPGPSGDTSSNEASHAGSSSSGSSSEGTPIGSSGQAQGDESDSNHGSPIVISIAGAPPATIAQSGNLVVVAQDGMTSTMPAGSAMTVEGHVFSAAASGGAVVVDAASTFDLPVPVPASAQVSATVLTVNGAIMTAAQQGQNIVFGNGGKMVTLQAGQTEVISSQTVIAPSANGGSIVIGGSTYDVAGAATGSAQVPATVITANGAIMTVSEQSDGSGAIIAASGSTVTLRAGETRILGSQTIAAPSVGGGMMIDGSTFDVPTAASTVPVSLQSAATWTKDGQTYTAIFQDGSFVLEGTDTTTTLPPGSIATFAGQTVSGPSSTSGSSAGLAIAHDGTTATLQATSFLDGARSDRTTFVLNGQTATAVNAGSMVILSHGGATMTLSAGQQSVLDGETISVLPSANQIVVNGTETVSLPVIPTHTTASSSSGEGYGPAGPTSTQSGATREIALASASVLLAICVVCMLLL